MTTAAHQYKQTGIKRLTQYKENFAGTTGDASYINDFVNLFCEYQLADNNYMDIHLHAAVNNNNEEWFAELSIDQVLRYMTYIIWTDKFSEGYLNSKVKDKTLYKLLCRLQEFQLS